ncbi:MAG: hypothetical protein QXZ28_04000, partial [Candidatus Methanomethylicaceae archaeon]
MTGNSEAKTTGVAVRPPPKEAVTTEAGIAVGEEKGILVKISEVRGIFCAVPNGILLIRENIPKKRKMTKNKIILT